MVRYKLFLLLLIAVLCRHGHAQLQLKIMDASDSSALVEAIVVLHTYHDTLLLSTNEMGELQTEVKLGDTLSYQLQVQAEGYMEHKESIKGLALKNMGIVLLMPDHVHKLGEVVITGQYKPQNVNASLYQMKIIDAQKISQMGAVNLGEVLTNVTNIRLSQDNILGSSMSMQGIGGENVKILVDGVPLVGRQNGNLDLSQINLNNIQRIEIVEGPLSVQYGTNALAGTINLITKQGAQQSRQVQVNTQYESVGNYNLGLLLQGKVKKVPLSLNMGRNFFDGWNPEDQNFRYIKEAAANSTRFQQWKPKEQYFAEGGLSYRYRATAIVYKPSYFQELILNRGLPIKPYEEKAFDDTYKTVRVNNAVLWNTSWRKHWSLATTTAYSYYERVKHTYYRDLTTLAKSFSENSTDHDTSSLGFWMSRGSLVHSKDSAKLNYELGYDAGYETAHGKRIKNKTQSIGDYALYGTAEYGLGKMVIKPGLRASYNTDYKAPLVPSLHVKYALGPRHVLRASYARGFRAPSLKELYFFFVDINHNIVGNPALRAEYSNNYTLGYTGDWKLGRTSLKTELSGFYNQIDDMITLALVAGQQYSYGNVGSFKTQGLQTNVAWTYKALKMNTSLSYIGRYNSSSEYSDAPNYSYSPELGASVAYQLKRQGLNLAVYYKYNGKMLSYQLVENVLRQSFINAYQWLDLSAQKDFWNSRLSITLGCKNLLKVTSLQANMVGAGGAHSSGAGTQALAMGRNYFVKLNWKIFR